MIAKYGLSISKSYGMKKLFLLTSLFLGFVTLVSAQSQTYYTLHRTGNEKATYYTFYKIDRKAKTFRFNSESSSDANMVIKNYKKAGAKETFDLHPAEDPGVKLFSVELNTDTTKQQTISFFMNGEMTESYVLGSKEQQEAQSESNALKPKATPTAKAKSTDKSAGPQSSEEKEKSGVKKAIDKGLSVFKKKK